MESEAAEVDEHLAVALEEPCFIHVLLLLAGLLRFPRESLDRVFFQGESIYKMQIFSRDAFS